MDRCQRVDVMLVIFVQPHAEARRGQGFAGGPSLWNLHTASKETKSNRKPEEMYFEAGQAVWRHKAVGTLVAVLALGLVAEGLPVVAPAPRSGTGTEPTPILIGAGDINDCGRPEGAQATAEILEAYPAATIFAAGDLAYFSCTAS